MLPIFTGHDPREAVGWHVFIQSLIDTSRNYCLAPPLSGKQIGGATNTFTLERFRVPELCGWSGPAVFLDGADMLLRGDISELEAFFDPSKALQVVKHNYAPRASRKYVGTEMEAGNEGYPRKNWSSVILFNAGHIAHFKAKDRIREAIESGDGKFLHRFGWLEDKDIGELPAGWNHLVSELPKNPQAKLVHFTLGIPGFDYYEDCEFADEWKSVLAKATRGMQYDFLKHSER